MIIVYTGKGKGKSCASVGQALRALGNQMRVAFYQFLKRDGVGGEQRILKKLLGENFVSGGLGFYRDPKAFPAHKHASEKLLALAREQIPQLDMLVLDEALYALGHGLLTESELHGLCLLCKEYQTHLVLSGRGAPQWLCDEADLITEMNVIKHPASSGIPAAPGIEF